jgi:DNA-binding transcriptional ArsR family regulator
MVVDKVSGAEADRVFHALADGTRRDILAVAVGGYSVSALAKRYPMSFAAVQKHVAVLEGAGLVTKMRRGREQLVRADFEAVARARVLLDGIEAMWRARVDRIDDLLAIEQRTPGGRAMSVTSVEKDPVALTMTVRADLVPLSNGRGSCGLTPASSRSGGGRLAIR